MRLIALCVTALLLAGCADSPSSRGGKVFGDNAAPRPKSIVVVDFVVSSDLVVIDRGYTARLEKTIPPYPILERRRHTLERVNDEIIATVVATLRAAGLDARPGNEEGISLAENTAVVSGRLAPPSSPGKKGKPGIGDGRSGIEADMTLSGQSSFGKKKLFSFTVENGRGRNAGGKTAAALNKSIGEVLGDKGAVKLSADVEAAARGLGRAAGDKIVAYAGEQGWLNKPDEDGADMVKPEAKPETKPEAQPQAKPVKKPEV